MNRRRPQLLSPPRSNTSARQTRTTGETLYFAYGSNLSFEQMARRCSQSRYIGRARLHGYEFQINERGYANVVSAKHRRSQSFVEGICYRLHPEDEDRLDRAEGVPTAYTKEEIFVEFFPAQAALLGRTVADLVRYPPPPPTGLENQDKDGEAVLAMVYLSTQHVTPGRPWDEYVIRMEQGVHQAMQLGVSSDYLEEEILPLLKPGRGNRLDRVQNRRARPVPPTAGNPRREVESWGGPEQEYGPRRPEEFGAPERGMRNRELRRRRQAPTSRVNRNPVGNVRRRYTI
ncbi:hypothetical protein TWF730_003470 [Orbilia blumenaviensis]|uniref:gamma-glutamylcyclotransferase n=1 Tax=Orbilia blumenaviensis TaxID=1796055 RepID=A0AAV9U6S0_9PEZI